MGRLDPGPAPIVGAIPRIERQAAHYRFLWAVRPPFAMIGLDTARKIVGADDTKPFFPPETSLVLTSTISDQSLTNYTWYDELRIVRELKPAYYIPFDLPVYENYSSEERQQNSERVADGTIDMTAALRGAIDSSTSQQLIGDLPDVVDIDPDILTTPQDTVVVPLVKGTTTDERSVCTSAADRIEAPQLCKYITQYFTVGESGGIANATARVEEIDRETQRSPLLLIGLLAPHGPTSLDQFPGNVVAAAGLNGWRKRIEPRTTDPMTMQEEFAAFSATIADVLEVEDQYERKQIASASLLPPKPFSKRANPTVDKSMPLIGSHIQNSRRVVTQPASAGTEER